MVWKTLACVTIAGAGIGVGGCGQVERVVSVTSEPPGALVFLNDQEVGRTPFSRDFTWYGTYDVTLRHEGYEAKHTTTRVIAPLWQWPPFDLLFEIIPGRWKDHRHYHYVMHHPTTQPIADEMLGRAEQLRLQLESSEHTKNPATMPTTKPLKRSTSRPTTMGASTRP